MSQDTLVQETESIKLDVPAQEVDNDDDVVDPWTVASKSDKGINYEKLIGL
jgi:hypothetical protein